MENVQKVVIMEYLVLEDSLVYHVLTQINIKQKMDMLVLEDIMALVVHQVVLLTIPHHMDLVVDHHLYLVIEDVML